MKSANKEIGFGKQTIAKVFEEWYTVPSYQRHYVWESDNVNDMLDDFASNYIEHAKEEYFLGSYIIQSKSNNNDLLDGHSSVSLPCFSCLLSCATMLVLQRMSRSTALT